MTVLGVTPLALRGSAHVLMVLTSASSESGNGRRASADQTETETRGREDALQSHQGVGCTDTSRRDEKKQRELTGQEGGDVIAVGDQGELGEGHLEVGELTDGREHFCKKCSKAQKGESTYEASNSACDTKIPCIARRTCGQPPKALPNPTVVYSASMPPSPASICVQCKKKSNQDTFGTAPGSSVTSRASRTTATYKRDLSVRVAGGGVPLAGGGAATHPAIHSPKSVPYYFKKLTAGCFSAWRGLWSRRPPSWFGDLHLMPTG